MGFPTCLECLWPREARSVPAYTADDVVAYPNFHQPHAFDHLLPNTPDTILTTVNPNSIYH